ncbi:MAG TPA: biotin-dependent carboxyltransferase family protein [Anaerolineales bacterium]|nr:biotin-dependent carboxyltransferase family protein [Anaerolineales bacterium]
MSLEVIDVSGLATIQDSGRKAWMSYGVPTAGAMDQFAFQAANALLGNTPDCAVIEIGLGDITFRALHDCVISVAGFGYLLSVYLWDFPLWSSYFIRGGWTIHLHKLDTGLWTYLAVTGGIQTPSVLGSRSTYLRGAFGGFEGGQLQVGDILHTSRPSVSLSQLAARGFAEDVRPTYSEHPIIDVILGPQANYFTKESIEKFFSQEYTVSTTSDRMGYRLEGPTLTRRNKTELISEGMTFGSIQVPSNGQPIVMMADGPTTGGYPKIGTVTSADLPLLIQCAPNKSRIRFRETTVAKAQKKYRAWMRGLNKIVESE